MKRRSGGAGSHKRVGKNYFVTKSGKAIKLNRNMVQRWVAHKDAKGRRKAERLAGLPKSRVKRFFYHFQPKRIYKYWFSRDGALMALKITGISIAAGFVILVGLFAYFRKDLPDLSVSGKTLGGSVRYYDRTGQTLLWEDYDAVKRIPVEDANISKYVKDATVAIEDKDFFKHGGFDVRGIMRAGFSNIFGKSGTTQGGSTITQQLVKISQQWTGDRTVGRKLKELILAVELERNYSKQEILTGYLNAAPYGGIEYGVEAAARDYFQKSAKDLTLPEAAMLAAIPKSPRFYSPYSADFDIESFTGRQHYILDLMEQQGMISKEERDEAKKFDVIATVKPRQPKYSGIKAPWFVLTAKEQLEERFGSETVQRGGWKITTTLDLNMQNIAEDEVNKGMVQVRRQGGDTAAFVASDVKTGQVVALVGGSDFSNAEFGQNNYARLRLPPGSSFKPYDYAALIENSDKAGAGSVLYDVQGPLEGYPCTNKNRPKEGGNCLWDYDFKYPGPVTLRYALGGSRNVPAVKSMLTVGVNKTIEMAEKLGLESGYNCYQDDNLTKEGPCYASSAIGDGAYLKLDEHVNAFGTLSRNGNKLPRSYILRIDDASNKNVYEWKQEKGEQAIREDTAYIISDILSDPKASYFSQKIHDYKGHKFSLKTGTTNDAKDGLLMGYSTQYAAGVWVGYHSRRVEMRGFMETMTRPIWNGWMQRVHSNLQPEERKKPSGVQTLPAFVVRSHVGTGSIEPSPTNDLYPSWYKGVTKASASSQTIDIVSNKLATDCTPERAKKTSNDAAANQFSVDRWVTGGATGADANTNATDDVHVCGEAGPSIDFANPPSVCSGTCGTIDVVVGQGAHPIDSEQFRGTINLLVNGQVVQTLNITGPGVYSFSGVSGSGTQSVVAEVIDSVLYSSSDTTTIDFSGSSPPSITSANPVTDLVVWSGGSGTVTIKRKSGGNQTCSGPPNGSCPLSGLSSGWTIYAEDSTGAKSSDYSV